MNSFAFKNSNIILKGYFEREKIILHEKNLKRRKIILLINFIFDPTFFLIASYQTVNECSTTLYCSGNLKADSHRFLNSGAIYMSSYELIELCVTF